MIVYVSGPYRSATEAGVFANIMAAHAATVQVWRNGHTPLCPHLNSMFMGGAVSSEEFLAGDLELISHLAPGVDILVLLPGWEQSEGSCMEAEHAVLRGLEVYTFKDYMAEV